ncbi:hypothetical protein Tsubulata_031021, partial [Turnera subulata]
MLNKMALSSGSGRHKRWSLQGMTALVTGGTKGIGNAVVEELASLGAIVHTCARKQDQINNVGANLWKPTLEYTAEDFAYMVGTNLESAYHLSQLGHPLLKASGAGSIIYLSSAAGVVSILISTDVIFNTGAMNQLTKNLACEWAKDNIRVNSVAPWFISTPLTE